MLVDRKALTLDAARGLVAAAQKHAAAHGLRLAIAVVDDGANLLCFERMDGAPIGCADVAQQKARTAVRFAMPSGDFEKGVAANQLSLLKLDILPFAGGLPIVLQGSLLGAIGASGATSAQDAEAAQAGIDWLLSALG